MGKAEDEQYSEAETVRRREATLKRLLNTPHKAQKPLGKKRGKASTKASTKR